MAQSALLQPHTSPDTDWDEVWLTVRSRLRAELGEATFKSWVQPLHFVSLHRKQLTLAAPTRFIREWVNTHFLGSIQKAWQEQAGPDSVQFIELIVKAGEPMQPSCTHTGPAIMVRAEPEHSMSAANDPLMDSGVISALDPRYTFDSFVVGKPNELAHAAARRVAESNEVVSGCNPLFLYGGVGLGKTHLMHAIAWHIRSHAPHRRVLYLSAERFMYEFIRALREKDVVSFKDHFRSVDVLMVDDVQFISGKESTQEEFFHTFNALVDANKQVVVSADRSPSDMSGMEERMKSRLGWGLVADINATTYELRLSILQTKAQHLPVQVPKNVMEFLAQKITSNVRELEGALNRVVAHSTLINAPVTLDRTEEILADLLRANERRVTIADIQKKTANHYNIKLSDMHSARRSRIVARPRQVAMYLAKKLTTLSLPEIGRQFGGKDHTTVMHAVKRIEELIQQDPGLGEDVQLLSRMLKN